LPTLILASTEELFRHRVFSLLSREGFLTGSGYAFLPLPVAGLQGESRKGFLMDFRQ